MADGFELFDGIKLPYDLKAEQAVLGAVLIDKDCLDNIVEFIPNKDYFYISNHKLIYGCMLQLYNKGAAVDAVTVLNELKKEPAFDQVEGKAYFLELAEVTPFTTNAKDYAKIVKENYEIRSLIVAAKNIIEEASEGTSTSSQLLDSAEQKIYDIRKGADVKSLEHIESVIYQTLSRLDALNSPDNEKSKPIPSGISDLDRVITGLNRSDLILLAARPGMGKTSFALNIARHVAAKAKLRVAFFSLEMTKEQLVSRLLSTEGLIEGTKLRSGKLNNDEWARLMEAAEILSKANMYLDETTMLTVPAMKAKLRRLKDVDLVLIDYLQLMGSTLRTENLVQVVGENTRSLKSMAKELNVPIILLSQLSRASEQRAEHRPMLSDLRDSGSIEQDADIVLFLYREGYYSDKDGKNDEDADMNSGECIVAKNRHGETNTVKLHWQGQFMRFTSQENRSE
ncbi:MAG: replicative DNA helicase [Acutalibacteraceae bacterium]|nr:replicative DNA helicase [Acutalibacteraceae bacterium]